MSKTIRIGVIGFGWMGQAHSRGCRRAPSYFLDRDYEPELVVVSDTVAARRDDAVRSFGYQRAVTDWRDVVSADDVDVVFVTAPNMLHVEMVEATAAAGKPVFCEKPVGGTPPQTVIAERAAR
ncbi:MAG: Gfo/Idh/MocA family oxidoreductase, partial [Ilumatobacteraceae bacterium]|nr:Gfo/Idh/MocA family oxidoreductase [Ilumatobacteraceae bacterium]